MWFYIMLDFKMYKVSVRIRQSYILTFKYAVLDNNQNTRLPGNKSFAEIANVVLDLQRWCLQILP